MEPLRDVQEMAIVSRDLTVEEEVVVTSPEEAEPLGEEEEVKDRWALDKILENSTRTQTEPTLRDQTEVAREAEESVVVEEEVTVVTVVTVEVVEVVVATVAKTGKRQTSRKMTASRRFSSRKKKSMLSMKPKIIAAKMLESSPEMKTSSSEFALTAISSKRISLNS